MQSAVLVANNGARQTAEAFVRARTMLLERGVHLSRTHLVDTHKELCRYVQGDDVRTIDWFATARRRSPRASPPKGPTAR